jgi:hypothetical protein
MPAPGFTMKRNKSNSNIVEAGNTFQPALVSGNFQNKNHKTIYHLGKSATDSHVIQTTKNYLAFEGRAGAPPEQQKFSSMEINEKRSPREAFDRKNSDG